MKKRKAQMCLNLLLIKKKTRKEWRKGRCSSVDHWLEKWKQGRKKLNVSKSINDLRKNKTEIEKLTKCTCGECKTERVSVKEDHLSTGRPPEHWGKKSTRKWKYSKNKKECVWRGRSWHCYHDNPSWTNS